VAGVLGLGAVLALRGVVQYTCDIPDTIATYRENQSAILAARGWTPDAPEAKLFESRLLAGELTGFFNMSNVYAAGLSAVILVGGMILWAQLRQLATAGARRSSLPLAVVLTAGVLLGSVWAIYYTGSRGGVLATLLAVGLLAGGWRWREVFARHWRRVFWAGAGLTVLGAIALVGHGWYHDSLPSKTMTFRWYYWTGAAEVIKSHPLTGVGLGNFGTHYLQVKRPQAPEDVKDPHNQIVRVAAELGLPVTALYGALLLWLLYRNARPTTPLQQEPTPNRTGVYTGIVVAGLWWVGYGALRLDATVWQAWSGAGPMLDNQSQQAGIWWWSDLITAGGYALVLGLCWWAVMRWCSANTLLVRLGLLMAALALLLHDQINIAVVTGPVALLLWLLLGAGVAQDEAKRAPVGRMMVGLVIVLWTALLILVGRYVGPDTQRMREQIAETMRAGDHTRTLQLMDALLAQEPSALDVCNYRIELKKRLGQSVGSDLETSLQLNPQDARLRWKYAYEMTDLPLARRRELLAEALTLDAALAPDEPKRLTTAQRERISKFLRDTAP
ncbi:MAG: O-antigen ligase family protein, partial [Phycisphaerae bacterium]